MPRWLNHVAVIVEQTNRDLQPFIIESLQSYHITVDENPAEAQYWLILQKDTLTEQIVSVSSSTTPRQYELTYTVQFKLVHARGAEIIASSHISVTRQATINSDRILGSNQEEAILVNEMRHDAAIQIMNRVSIELI
jgi:LPS-assembly lipoprotein